MDGCPVSYASQHHDYPATDIFASGDCTFVAPVTGVVDEVTLTDRWDASTNVGRYRGGLSISLVGVDGVRYYGSHLRSVVPGVRSGAEVSRGQALGKVGDTGSAAGTGTHLHFGISWPTPSGSWWVRRGMLGPQPYLDSWRSGGDLSPAAAVARAKSDAGDVSRCLTYC